MTRVLKEEEKNEQEVVENNQHVNTFLGGRGRGKGGGGYLRRELSR